MECIEFINNFILPNSCVIHKICELNSSNNINQFHGHRQQHIESMDISSSLLKALLLVPSKKIIDFILPKVKNWNANNLHSQEFRQQTHFDQNLNFDFEFVFNILLNSSDDIKQKYCSKQIQSILQKSVDILRYIANTGIHINEDNEAENWLKILECIELYGKAYLDKEYMMTLKIYLLRLNERYLHFKQAKEWEIIVVTRRILKSLFGIDGEKIINKKYDQKEEIVFGKKKRSEKIKSRNNYGLIDDY